MHDQIEIARGHVTVRGEVALLVLLAGGEGETEPAVPAAGAVRVRPTGLTAVPARNRYQ